MRPSYLYERNSYTGKVSLYWIGPRAFLLYENTVLSKYLLKELSL